MIFQDRTDAGRWLAEKLRPYASCPHLLVLGITPGGVTVAREVARVLQAPLAALLIHPLKRQRGQAPAQVAITSSNGGIITKRGSSADASDAYLRIQEQQALVYDALDEGDDRSRPDLRGRTILLIDEGMATGTTMQAAITMLRSAQPARLIIALPVASARSCQKLCTEADALVCLQVPQHFSRSSDWYRTSDQ